jgi:hypothetical protein
MFDFLSLFSKKRRRLKVRNVLFGDLPISQWPNDSAPADTEPWLSFVKAREALDAGRTDDAVALYHSILAMPGLEARHYLQAWQVLRQAGVEPDETVGKRVYGVVMEVALPQGLDILAAYADGTARYFNHGGSAIVWDAPNDSLAELVGNLLGAGQQVADQIGPWEGERPGPPGKGQARVSMLTPSGLHFGQAPFDALAQDPLGRTVVAAANQLMLSLIEKTKERGEEGKEGTVE